MRVSNQFADATTGVIYIHSSPAAVCPHIEWALAATLNSRPELTWTGQPADVGVLRTSVDWAGPVGTAGRLADALLVWPMLRFEITENPSEGVDGERYSYVPRLGSRIPSGSKTACARAGPGSGAPWSRWISRKACSAMRSKRPSSVSGTPSSR